MFSSEAIHQRLPLPNYNDPSLNLGYDYDVEKNNAQITAINLVRVWSNAYNARLVGRQTDKTFTFKKFLNENYGLRGLVSADKDRLAKTVRGQFF